MPLPFPLQTASGAPVASALLSSTCRPPWPPGQGRIATACRRGRARRAVAPAARSRCEPFCLSAPHPTRTRRHGTLDVSQCRCAHLCHRPAGGRRGHHQAAGWGGGQGRRGRPRPLLSGRPRKSAAVASRHPPPPRLWVLPEKVDAPVASVPARHPSPAPRVPDPRRRCTDG